MAVNLVKGENRKLDLNKFRVGLGWDVNEDASQFDFDLDVAAFMIGGNKKTITDLYIGTLFLEFLENFSLSDFGIEGQQLVYECFNPVKALFGGGEVEQFFYGKDPCTMNDGLVGMVYQHVAVGLVFLAEEDQIHAEVLLHFLLQFFLVGAYVPVFLQVGSQLAVACLVLITFLIKGFNLCQGEFLLDSASLLDEDVAVFLEDFIAHGSHHGLELGKGGETVLLGSLDVLVCFLLPVHTEYFVNYHL